MLEQIKQNKTKIQPRKRRGREKKKKRKEKFTFEKKANTMLLCVFEERKERKKD